MPRGGSGVCSGGLEVLAQHCHSHIRPWTEPQEPNLHLEGWGQSRNFVWAAPRTRPLLMMPLGIQGHSRGIPPPWWGFWGGSSHSGGSGADSSVPTAGCTFEEDNDPNQCEYSQGEDDDFDWELIRSYLMPHLTPDLPHGESWGPWGPPVSCTPGLGCVTPPGLIPAVF